MISKFDSIRYRITITFIAVFFGFLFFCGCKKWSHNGHLDGMWQVMEVTYADSLVEVPDDARFYYNFYLHTFQLSTHNDRPESLIGNMTYEASQGNLYLELPKVRDGGVSKKWLDMLVYWGVPKSGEMDVNIRQLTSSRLVMEYDSVVIVCRKF